MLILSSTRQHCSDLQSVVGLNVVRRHINAVQRLINVSSTSYQRRCRQLPIDRNAIIEINGYHTLEILTSLTNIKYQYA